MTVMGKVPMSKQLMRAFVRETTKFDFATMEDAQEWAHRASLIFDTDEECQAECERLLTTVTVRERDCS